MNGAYHGKLHHKDLRTRSGEQILSLEDLCERLDERPAKADVEAIVPHENAVVERLLKPPESKRRRDRMIWGYVTSIAAERKDDPVRLFAKEGCGGLDFAGLELGRGRLIITSATTERKPNRKEQLGGYIGQGMSGGRITVDKAGDYLGQGMSGGGIVAGTCKTYSFRNMRAGFGVVMGDAGDYVGVGNGGGRILVKGNVGFRSGWLMSSGRLVVRGDAGDYLGLMMKGGLILVRGTVGKNAGEGIRGGSIESNSENRATIRGKCSLTAMS
jgi:formylmethanofuran dehydrogenase subunit C